MKSLPRIVLALAAAAGLAACHKDSAKPAEGTQSGSQAASSQASGEEPQRNLGPGPLAGRHGPPDRQRPADDRGPGDHGGGWDDKRAEFDTDGDGQLSDDERAAMHEARQAEHEQRRQEMMAKFDKDGDGQLSDDERTAMRTERVQGMVTHLDTDGDGKVSQAELEAGRGGGRHRPKIDFATADTDHDGSLSAAELQAAMPDRGPGGYHPHDDGEPDAPDAPPAP